MRSFVTNTRSAIQRSFASPGGFDFLNQTVLRDEKQPLIAPRNHYPVMIDDIENSVAKFINQRAANDRIRMVDCCIGTGGHTFNLLENHPNLYW